MEPYRPLECTDSRDLVTADVAGAVMFGAMGLAMVTSPWYGCVGSSLPECGNAGGVLFWLGWPALGAGALYAASAISGIGTTSRCRDVAERKKDACAAGDQSACGCKWDQDCPPGRSCGYGLCTLPPSKEREKRSVLP